jgi:hypothetical protein
MKQIIKLIASTGSALNIISLLTFWSGLVYFVHKLDWSGILISIIMTTTSVFLLKKYSLWPQAAQPAAGPRPEKKTTALAIMHAVLCAACFVILWQSRTANSAISPWETVPWFFFAAYTAASLVLTAYSTRQTAPLNTRSAIPLILHYGLSFSVLLVIFKIGYGFDPFVHSATLEIISEKGEVDPKPLYYLGYYGLVTLIHKLTFIPIDPINRLIVPLASAILLPHALFFAFSDKISRITRTGVKSLSGAFFLCALLAVVLPFSILTFSTPQNFAFLLLILSVLYGLGEKTKANAATVSLLSLAAMAIHPIAGIPAVIFAFLRNFIYDQKPRLAHALIALSVFALPVSFAALSPGQLSGISLRPLVEKAAGFMPADPQSPDAIMNAVYLFGFNRWLIIAALIAFGAAIAWQSRLKPFTLCGALAAAFFFSFLLTLILPFDFLIDYERSDYAERILAVSVIFALPFALLALSSLAKNALAQPPRIRIQMAALTALLLTASLYHSYPRADAFHNSRSHSTGQAEIEAVRRIDSDAKGADYIVLANQQVSAAALKEFGFRKYYHGDIFFYPVPTGGKLYPFYLDMVYEKPDKKTMDQAMDLAGVDTGYFVLNKYWWAFKKIADEAKLSADSWESINDGDILVFKYKRY